MKPGKFFNFPGFFVFEKKGTTLNKLAKRTFLQIEMSILTKKNKK